MNYFYLFILILLLLLLVSLPGDYYLTKFANSEPDIDGNKSIQVESWQNDVIKASYIIKWIIHSIVYLISAILLYQIFSKSNSVPDIKKNVQPGGVFPEPNSMDYDLTPDDNEFNKFSLNY